MNRTLTMTLLGCFCLSLMGCKHSVSHQREADPQPPTLSDTTKVDSLDDNTHNSIQEDSIDSSEHIHIVREWCYPEDSVRFDAIVDIDMDKVYATPAIRKHLFSMMDNATLGVLMFVEENVEARSPNIGPAPCIDPAPCTMPSAEEYSKAWGKLMDDATKRYGGSKVSSRFYKIQPLYSSVSCHKVYEDNTLVTYHVKGNYELHGGCGERSMADYLTFDKATSRLLTLDDFVKKSTKEDISKKLNEAYLKKFPDRSEYGPELVDSVSGVGVIDDGVIFYFYPYTIGCGADGQISFILDRSLIELQLANLASARILGR